MQVQKIQNNNNLNFGQLKKIESLGAFSCSRKGQDEAVAALLNSEEYKKFGDTHDYIAQFYWKYPDRWDPSSTPYEYTLELKLPNPINPKEQPIYIKAAEHYDTDYHYATKGFIEKIKANTHEQLSKLVDDKTRELENLDIKKRKEEKKQHEIDETIKKNAHLFY